MQFALRSITNKSIHTGLGRGCFDVLLYIIGQCCTFVSMAERNTQCIDGEFSSTVNAALKKKFAGISSFNPQQFEA